MHHLQHEVTEILKRSNFSLEKLGLYFSTSLLPETYRARDIADFKKEKNTIKTTRTLLPIRVFSYNFAFVYFPSATYNITHEQTGRLSDESESVA